MNEDDFSFGAEDNKPRKPIGHWLALAIVAILFSLAIALLPGALAHADIVLTTSDFAIPDSDIGALEAEYKKAEAEVKTAHKKSFSDMDVEKIRLACRTTRESAMVEVMLSTGCRVFECTELTIEQCKGDEIQIVGKGEKPRTVFLNAKAQIAIDVYLKERKDDNPYLFPASINVGISAAKKKPPRGGAEWYLRPEQVSKDDHIDKSSFGYIIRKIGKRAGVENCHPHRFRRTCATFALRRGMDVTLVQMMLGHESLETTQRYLDIADEDLKTAHKRYVV